MSDRIREVYDTVAEEYAASFGDELTHKPLDRALLAMVAERADDGPVGDLGCGPAQAAALLQTYGVHQVVGVDLSLQLLRAAARPAPESRLVTGDLRTLPLADSALAAAVAFYSIVHLDAAGRDAALREMARVLRPGGCALVAFHVRAPGIEAGSTYETATFLGHAVPWRSYFLDPDEVSGAAARAGLVESARCLRGPLPDVEYPSERCYLLLENPSR